MFKNIFLKWNVIISTTYNGVDWKASFREQRYSPTWAWCVWEKHALKEVRAIFREITVGETYPELQ